MINLVIVSKDRPCQAHALLESIEKYCPNLFNINLLYVATSPEYYGGFEILKSEFPKVNYVYHEFGEFKEKLLEIFRNGSEIVCFSTEDTLIYDSANFSLIEDSMEDVSVFSLRYGLNTVMQDEFNNIYQPPLTDYADEDETVSWFPERYQPLHNYGYFFGMDMHCYHRDEFIGLCEMIEFDRPTELESRLFNLRHLIKPKIRAFKKSVAVNVPLTNMTGVTQNMEVDIHELNSEYINGKRLKYEYNKEDIIGCHQKLDWKMA